VAFRYLDVTGRDSLSANLSQPAVELNLEGRNLGGSPIGLVVDARTRYTTTSLPGAGVSQDGLTRVYQAALFFNAPGSPLRFTAGRQYSPVLSSVSYFDGLLTEYNRDSWGVGALAGFQPDPATLQFSTQIHEYGGYFQLHNRPTAIETWSLTLGAIGSYDQGHQNREFAYLQGTYASRRLSAFVAQEVDFYAPSKQALGEPAVSPTSTLANLAVRVGDAVTLTAGFDNRRTVRLYRDLVTPVTLFDDSFRESAWGGVSVFLAHRFRLGADVRSAVGGPDVGADAYTGYLSGDRLTPLKLNFRIRSSRYFNSTVAGWLHSGALGVSPTPWLQVEAIGGVRDETQSSSSLGLNRMTWYGTDFDLAMGRAWYFTGAWTRETGTINNDDQFYTGLSYRF
jgi:hypothetical protein